MTRRFTQPLARALLTLVLICLFLPDRANAHFSYSDPRIVHVMETDSGKMAILVRMPAPLALLPTGWQGGAESKLPPFGKRVNGEVVLDMGALRRDHDVFHQILRDGLAVQSGDNFQDLEVSRTRFWSDVDRPSFGTAKSALKSLGFDPLPSDLAYFDATLDVEFIVPRGAPSAPLRIHSNQGATFQVIENFATVVKLHRDGGSETQAMIGVLRAEFPAAQTEWQNLFQIAWIGAEHIYLGFDHLAMILLVALAAVTWRQALLWASTFTAGHILTLAAGLYGYAPQASWFIPVIEVLIVSSIVIAGGAIFSKKPHVVNGPMLFIVGLIHGYGFASAANVALFAGEVDAVSLAAFAVGLEVCQLAVYLAVLPIIVLMDRVKIEKGARWRRSVALMLAVMAGVSVIQQLMHVSGNLVT